MDVVRGSVSKLDTKVSTEPSATGCQWSSAFNLLIESFSQLLIDRRAKLNKKLPARVFERARSLADLQAALDLFRGWLEH